MGHMQLNIQDKYTLDFDYTTFVPCKISFTRLPGPLQIATVLEIIGLKEKCMTFHTSSWYHTKRQKPQSKFSKYINTDLLCPYLHKANALQCLYIGPKDLPLGPIAGFLLRASLKQLSDESALSVTIRAPAGRQTK